MARQRSTWKTALGAVAVSGVALLAAAPPALAQDTGGGPDPTQAPVQERVSAQVLPGVVRIGMASDTAYVINPANGDTYTVQDGVGGTCTGVVLSADGYIGTAGHCVDPDFLGNQARAAVVQTLAAQGVDPQAAEADLARWVVSADPSGQSALPIAFAVMPSTGKPGDKPLTATVVDYQGPDKGDVALLKVDATNMLTVPMAPGDETPVGEPIMAIGYPGAREDSGMDKSLAPVTEEGRVSSQQSRQGIAYTEITADLGHGMSGGPTVDLQGQVVGINAQLANEATSSAQFNYVSPVSRLRELATRAGVNTTAGPADTAYRAGLGDYFAGHYGSATDEFDQALAAAPGNKGIQDYRDKATRAHGEFGDSGFSLGSLSPKTWGYLGGGVLLLLIFVGSFVGALLRKRRGPAGPTGTPAAFAPGGSAPAPHAPTVPGPRRPEYSQQMPDVETGPVSPAVGFPSPVGPANATMRSQGSEDSTVRAKVVRPTGGGTVAPERPRVAAGFCPRCGAARTPGAGFCGSCGAGGH